MRLDLPLESINVKKHFYVFLSRFCVFDVRYVSINRWAIQHGHASDYPRESFREGLCNHRRTFVCPAVCLSLCYHDN